MMFNCPAGGSSPVFAWSMIRGFYYPYPGYWPGIKKDRFMNRTEFIQEYLDRGFSLIPLKNNSKVP
ncbi:unnamed protein product, partial [marine sediment metagenome]